MAECEQEVVPAVGLPQQRVEVTATALIADKGPGILWFLRDLDGPTKDGRQVTEVSLAASQQRLQLFVVYAPAALAMFDRDVRYIVASRRWRADYGLPDDGLTGRSHYDVFPEVSDEWKAIHRRALAGETVTADEDRCVRADASVQWLRWAVRPCSAPPAGSKGSWCSAKMSPAASGLKGSCGTASSGCRPFWTPPPTPSSPSTNRRRSRA